MFPKSFPNLFGSHGSSSAAIAGAALAVLGLAVGTATATAVNIYTDNFTGGATAPLNGASPGMDLTGGTWSAASYWNANGSASTNNVEQADAILPFTPTSGEIYNLSITASPGSPAAGWQWLAFGFVNTTSSQTSNIFGSAAGPWMLQEPNSNSSTSDLGQYFASGNGNIAGYASPQSPITMGVVLDTTAAQWTAQWYYDGSPVQGEPYTFSTNPSITGVGFGVNYNTAVVGAFSLTGTSVPEPVGLAIFVAGGLGLLLIKMGRRSPTG